MPTSILTAISLFLWQPAQAGPPKPEPPCDGERYDTCLNGTLYTQCCPAGSRCQTQVHTNCGYGRCIAGGDRGRCPVLEPNITAERTPEACKYRSGTWERACVKGQVTMACFPMLPTNFSGAGQNPAFTECGGGRCTTSGIPEACYPTREETKTCSGAWEKACIGGKVEERCLPANATRYATGYVTCSDGGCAIGPTTASCP